MLGKLRRLLPYAAARWWMLAVILLLTVTCSLLAALQPWPLKLLIDYGLERESPPGWLSSMLAAIALDPEPAAIIVLAAVGSLSLFALTAALDLGLSWAWTITGQRMVYDLAAHLFARLQRLSLLFHGRRNVGDSLDRLSTDTWCLYVVAAEGLVSPLQNLLTIAAIGAAAWMLDPGLTLLALAVAPLLAAAARYFGPRLRQRARENREAQAKLVSLVHQTLTAIPVTQAFCAEDRNRQRYQSLAEDAVAATQKAALVNRTFGLVTGMTKAVGAAVVLFAGGQRVLSGALSIGSLVVFLAYVRSLQGAFDGLFQTYGKLKTAEASIDRVLEVLDAEEVVHEDPHSPPLADPPHGRRGHVRIEGVTFGYDAGRAVLHDVTLEARPGETVALVGPTGAGKSTLVSLIPRFFDPWQGRVLFDGVDVRQVQLASLRAQVAIVLQEPFLLPLSMAENIAYARPSASRDEIEAAARVANAHEFIQQLPQGYDTVIGERGATLSGGEKQRLAIARAVLKDAAVVILDEPTSALDTGTEGLVLEALDRLTAGRTTFVIAHRFSTIRRADRIVVVNDGRVVEQGTHAELMQAGELYHRLYSLQSAAVSQEVPA